MDTVETAGLSVRVEPRRKTATPGHALAAAVVTLLAVLWTQLVAAITLVLMWFAWQDPRNLAWPDNDRVILMSLTLLTVLAVSLILASRFGWRKAAQRDHFRQIWYTGGGAAGAWFGLPMYMAVTWDHLVMGGHDAATIISVGAMFVVVGGLAGTALALASEPAAYWLYQKVQNRAASVSSGRRRFFTLLTWIALPVTLAVGAALTLGLLALGPRPVADPLYPGATLTASKEITFGCLGTLRSYRVEAAPATVLAYYGQLADAHKYNSVILPGGVKGEDTVPLDLRPPTFDPASFGIVRYSNTAFASPAYAYDSVADGCRSTRLYLSSAPGGGTLISTVQERPGHVH